MKKTAKEKIISMLKDQRDILLASDPKTFDQNNNGDGTCVLYKINMGYINKLRYLFDFGQAPVNSLFWYVCGGNIKEERYTLVNINDYAKELNLPECKSFTLEDAGKRIDHVIEYIDQNY